MMNNLISSIYDTQIVTSITPGQFAAVTGAALILGLVLAAAYKLGSRSTKSFAAALALLPAIVSAVIIMVNGSVGTGVAVAGAFSLVRFRSVPGSAREICAIFLAMTIGLITGMGYLGLAAAFTIVMCLMFFLYGRLDLGSGRDADKYKTLRIVVPEDLDYTDIFKDIFDEYTDSCEVTQVKTTNMGSMFKLTYDVVMKDPAREKEMIDKLRCRNGNLEITVSRQGTAAAEL